MTKQTTTQKPVIQDSETRQPVDSVLDQISTMDQSQLSELLRAIAYRIYPIARSSARRIRD